MSLRYILSPRFIALLALAASSFTRPVQAASVLNGGYTNAFGALPAAADWSTVSIAGDSAGYASALDLDTGARAYAASGITGLLTTDAASPPTAIGTATWSSSGLYLQTRPTSVKATLLLCTLNNATTHDVGSVTISYDLAKATSVTEEVEAHLAYYSTSGAANSWVPIPEFSLASPGRLTTTLVLCWPAGTTLYLLWADDNGTGSPDSAYQIDNFSVIPAPLAPASITTQPQGQTNNLGTPIVLSVVAAGTCPTYQWQTNNPSGVWVNITGATSSVYSNANSPNGFLGARDFRVVVSGSANSVISSLARVMYVEDTTGPLALSAVVDSANSNRIDIFFNELLFAFGTTSTVASSVSPIVLSNGTFRVVMLGSNVNATVNSSSYNSGPPIRASLIMGSNNWFVGSNYYIILNNIRDSRTNVIAPNTIVPVTWPIITNVVSTTNASQVWHYHAAYIYQLYPCFPDFSCPGSDVFTSAWNSVTYTEHLDAATYWASTAPTAEYPSNGPRMINDRDETRGTNVCWFGSPTTGVNYQEQALLVRTEFLWPTNANSPTNADLIFTYGADDAAAFFLNGTFIFADNNFPSGNITAATRAVSATEGPCKTFTVANALLRRGTNVLAAAIAQSGVSSDSGFACSVDAKSFSTSVLPPNGLGTNSAAPSWSRTNILTRTKLTPSASPTNLFSLSWATNAYGFALMRSTNVNGPWGQVQPLMANPYVTNSLASPRYFYRLMSTQ